MNEYSQSRGKSEQFIGGCLNTAPIDNFIQEYDSRK